MKVVVKIYFFVSIVFCSTVFAERSVRMTLNSILANDSLIFSLKRNHFNCYPYGVIVLEKFYRDDKVSLTCKKNYQQFQQKNPKLYFFAYYHFHVKQNYMVELKKEGCLVFSKGQKTYSEFLLEKGLAIIDPKIKNEKYKNYFFYAQQRAKRNKKGIWGDSAMQKCIAELLK